MIYWRALSNRLADGYAYASDNISSRLKDAGVLSLEDLSYINTSTSSIYLDPDSGQFTFTPDPEGVKILINNCLPSEYSFEGNYIIGFTYWETTKVPDHWIPKMNQCDEIWTTSEWAKQCFIDNGITVPIYAFNLGVDTKVFYKNENWNRNPFTFMHIGSPSTRKNTQLVYDAFRKLFKNDNKFNLIIKSNGPPDVRKIFNGENFGSVYGVEGVHVMEQYLTDQELSELFNTVNCFVYPTKGEGWGMAPFQAIAKGVPTICTNQTACTEFAHLSIPLEAELGPVGNLGIYTDGLWADPKIDDVCDKMLYVVNNYEEALEITSNGSDYIHKNYSWDKVALDYKKRILELIEIYGK